MRRALLTLLFCFVGFAQAYAKVALIIGNGSYTDAPLANPPNDARLIAQTLRGLGFEVTELIDADQRAMKRAVRDFGARMRSFGPDGVGLFYYAGHGVQSNGTNFLIPVGAQVAHEADLDIEAVDAQAIVKRMEQEGSQLNIVILDACRNNPYARPTRGVKVQSGFARLQAPAGSFIAYSTSPGNVAEDGSGQNSPYSRALAVHLAQPGLPIEEVFKRVRRSVMQETNRRQVPWESSSIIDDFYPAGRSSGTGTQVALSTTSSAVTSTVRSVLTSTESEKVAKPGFNCAKATTPQEKIICLEPRLAKADRLLNDAYRALRTRINDKDSWRVVRNSQRQWIKDRDRSCTASRSDISNRTKRRVVAACLEHQTLQRAGELDVWH